MALSKAKVREILSTAGVDSEHMSAAVDAIIDGNVASIEALREDVAKYKADAEKLTEVQKELDALKANNGDDYKTKYESECKAFADYKAEVTAKESKAAREAAAKAYFEGKNITGANLDIAMRGARDEIGALEMDGDKIKDTAALDALVSGTYAGLVVTTTKQGVNTATPPASNGGNSLTKADLYKRDEHGRYIMSTAERQKALAEHPELMK